ncbi:hypothetical protein PspLS_02385 [Pyricularia sp. CBS 133598]|nr:hypothetical protein PspLS_02385 [Pyricularia sp. CBS 133598]
MATIHAKTQWSEGELAVQDLLRVPARPNPTAHGLPIHYVGRVQAAPLVAVGALDADAQPWTSIWAGEPGFVRAIAPDVVGMRSLVDKAHDPVAGVLFGDLADGEVYSDPNATGSGRPMSALAIDLETRDRVKVAGRLVAGVRSAGAGGKVGDVQLAMAVTESIGNCPKYLNKKGIRLHVPEPELVSDALPLPAHALEILERADMFFMSTSDGRGDMDTNHRGGPPGLLRVVSNGEDDAGVVLAYPEFSGNRLYSSLGNLHVNDKVGITIPDFGTGDAMYLTGTARLLVGETAARLLPRTKVAVRIEVMAAKVVKDGLPFRGEAGEFSPYNPPVRRLATEIAAGLGMQEGKGSGGIAVAVLKQRQVLSPTITRYTFALQAPTGSPKGQVVGSWTTAQHATFDFSSELDAGYSHMRDDDPQSLNDDFVRTFTVSNPPAASPSDEGAAKDGDMQITVRTNGPVTRLLRNWNLRAPLEIPVMAFGGGSLQIPSAGDDAVRPAVFVATGVGITPLLSQAGALLSDQQKSAGARLSVLWSLRKEDLPFAADEFKRTPGLGAVTQLYVSDLGATADSGSGPQVEVGQENGASLIIAGRLTKQSLLDAAGNQDGGLKAKFYICAGPAATKAITEWLADQDVITESFNY